MEYRHISQINFQQYLNSRTYGVFLAQDVDVRTQNDGFTKYLTLNMVDKDIKVNAKRFGATEQEIEKMKSGNVYYAAIDVKPYKKDPSGYSCIIYNFDIWDSEPASNFISWADGMTEAYNVVQDALNYISSTIYGNLVGKLITSNWDKFSVWAAASGMHHNLPGGLLVHTAEVVRQSKIISSTWKELYGEKFVNEPLLVSSALIHDLAKIYELNVDTSTGIIEYSTDSSLETHISKCISMVEVEAYKQGFGLKTETKSDETVDKEQEALKLLKHCVLAHHGKKEYGSPIDANCPEAYILHVADKLSAEMYRFNKNFKNMESGTSSSAWLGGNISVTYKDTSK